MIEDRELAEKILRYRIKNNLSQKEFADKVGITTPVISYIENCKGQHSNSTKMKILMFIEE